MRTWTKLGLGVGAIAMVTGGTLAWRTANFAPDVYDGRDGPTLAAAPPFDAQKAAVNLGAAIRIQTVSHQDAKDNQPAEWDKLHSWMQTTYPDMHRAMAREMVGQSLIYTWTGSDPAAAPIILMAHQDVVPVMPGTEKDWKYPPFGGQIAENAVWGRGAVDDKGSLISLCEAFEALAKSGFKPKRTIYLVSGYDEEVGGTGAAAIAKLLGQRGVKAQFTLDEGSLIVEDAPTINAPAVLIGVGEKGYATLRITAKAAGGHSSMPPKDIATVNLSNAVTAINKNQFAMQLRQPASEMVDILAGRAGGSAEMAAANKWLFGGTLVRKIAETPSGAAMLHTTIAPTMMSGSPKENVLPQIATALVNYRIAPWQTSDDIMAAAKAATRGIPVELSWDSPPREPTKLSSTSSDSWRLIAALGEAEAKGAPVAPYLVLGGTDSRNFGAVSEDVYRFAPLRFSMKDTAMVHGTNERISIDNLDRMIRFYTRLIATSAG